MRDIMHLTPDDQNLIDCYGLQTLIVERICAQRFDEYETLWCRCPLCEGSVPVVWPRGWDVVEMQPIEIAAGCKMCAQIWVILERREHQQAIQLTAVQSYPSWRAEHE